MLVGGARPELLAARRVQLGSVVAAVPVIPVAGIELAVADPAPRPDPQRTVVAHDLAVAAHPGWTAAPATHRRWRLDTHNAGCHAPHGARSRPPRTRSAAYCAVASADR